MPPIYESNLPPQLPALSTGEGEGAPNLQKYPAPHFVTGSLNPTLSQAKDALHGVHPVPAESPVVSPYVPLGQGFSLPVAEPPGGLDIGGMSGNWRVARNKFKSF